MNLRKIRIRWIWFLERIFPNSYDFLTDWLLPPYYKLRKLFGFCRYDIVRLPHVGRLEYAGISYRILDSVFQLFIEYIEKEKPFDVIDFTDNYVMNLKSNYKDIVMNGGFDVYEDTVDKNGNKVLLEDKLKSIYQYVKFDRYVLIEDRQTLLNIWCKFHEIKFEEVDGKKDFYTMKDVYYDFSIDSLNSFEIEVYNKYIPKDKIGDIHYINLVFKRLQYEIDEKDQNCLIDIIKIRETLWT